MRVGIIAEGRADLAVITNILKGCLDLDHEHLQYLRPEYDQDETDLHARSAEMYSNWEIVKKECVDYSRIEDFLNSPLDEERLVIIHIDAAECEQPGYDVSRPKGEPGPALSAEVHKRITAKLDEWFAGRGGDRLRYAIAVEETDAWLLTLYSRKETSTYRNVKEVLQKELNRPNRRSDRERKRDSQRKAFELYGEWSKPFRKLRQLQDCMRRNKSLQLFVESLVLGTQDSQPGQ